MTLLLTVLLWRLLRDSGIGRAIVAVRMDRINAITFGIGALMAGAAGALLSIIFPISPLNSGSFLGKAFVVCVLGGLGSVPGAIVGGIVLRHGRDEVARQEYRADLKRAERVGKIDRPVVGGERH